MQPSGNTHTYTKRNVALDPALVAGIVIGVAALNALLAISWFILRDRQRLNNRVQKRRISAPADVEKYEHSLAFAITTGAVPAARPLRGKAAPRPADGKPYRDLILAMHQEHGHRSQRSSPTRLSHASSRTSPDRRLSKFLPRPKDVNVKKLSGVPKFLPNAKSPPQTSRQDLLVEALAPTKHDPKHASYLTETASVYSSASAPPEYHENLFRTQPFALDPTLPTSAPPWIHHLPMPPPPAVVSDASSAECDLLLSPTASISENSDTATIRPFRERLSNSNFSSQPQLSQSIFLPLSSPATHSFTRARTQSSPSAPPQVRWITTPSETAASPTHSSRPTSVSSLSTIFSIREPVSPVTVVPLNFHHPSKDTQWGSVELTRSTPLPPARPARSDKRPAPSASMEHLPVTFQYS